MAQGHISLSLPPYKHLHQPKMRIKLKRMKMKIKKMSHLKRRAMIKGEMLMISSQATPRRHLH
jgi:hypothetical protein